MKINNFIYSSASEETLDNLLKTFGDLYGMKLSLDKMFYYGVFCKEDVYANYFINEFSGDCDCNTEEYGFCIPTVLLPSSKSGESERILFVEHIIFSIMKGEIEKPEWMLYVEETSCNNGTSLPPSTFLKLYPKESKYDSLSRALLEYLYSPNLSSDILEN